MLDYSWHARAVLSVLRRPRGAVAAMGLALTCSLWASAPTQADTGSEETAPLRFATLEVEIVNLESDEGVLVVVLLDSATQYDSGDTFFRSHETVPIRENRASVSFEQIPYGTYAIKIFHDENSNGKLDTNFVGFPKEGFGFSNDAMGKFGPPTFDQASFAVEAEKLRVQITAQ
jgi:uncharacterized protein (DUF2141 family)